MERTLNTLNAQDLQSSIIKSLADVTCDWTQVATISRGNASSFNLADQVAESHPRKDTSKSEGVTELAATGYSSTQAFSEVHSDSKLEFH